MMTLTIHKFSGSGNDFVIVDNRDGQVSGDPTVLARALCPRRTSVGADGLILVERSARADVRMRYLNADGGEVEMCGNGTRCLALFSVLQGITGPHLTIETPAGLVHAQVEGGSVKVGLYKPHGLRLNLSLTVEGEPLLVHCINTGVPHAVLLVEEAETAPVVSLGRALRYHPQFHPPGTNVDFVEVLGPQSLRVRTYERGVEDETLACGTGVVAGAILAGVLEKVSPPVKVETRGGEVLTVNYRLRGEEVEGVELAGRVRYVFRGEYLGEQGGAGGRRGWQGIVRGSEGEQGNAR